MPSILERVKTAEAEKPQGFMRDFADEPNWVIAHNNPVKNIDPFGLTTITFSKSAGFMYIYLSNGIRQGARAANITTNPGGNPNVEGSEGPAPNGVWSVSRVVQVTSGDANNDDVDDVTQFGGVFIGLNIPTRPGIGIHAGRSGYQSRTHGCIRVNNGVEDELYKIHQRDPITSVTITD